MAKRAPTQAKEQDTQTPPAQVSATTEAKQQEVVVNTEKPSKDAKESTGSAAYKSRASIIRELADKNRETRDVALREEGIEPVNTRGERQSSSVDDEDTAAQKLDDDSDHGEQSVQQQSHVEQPDSGEHAQEQTTTQKRKFIIDGREVELTDDQITAYVQKGATADHRLQQATQLLTGARMATQGNGAAMPQPPGYSSPDAAIPPSGQVPDAKKLTQAILYGREEEATEAIATILGRGRQAGDANIARDMTTQAQGMSQQQVQALVSEQLAFHAARELLDTPPEQGGFGDVYSDSMLRNMFIARDNQLLDGGDARSYKERYAAIATEIRQWRDGFIKTNTPKTGLENREDRKRAAGVVRGGGGTPPPPPPESRPKTHEEKLAQIRAARGQ